MNETTCRKTFKEKLRPTPAQERALDEVLWRCRDLYNTALAQRITAWQRCHISVSRFEQEAGLKAIRTEFPEYASVHSHILQDVLARLDKTYQDFFRRVQRGEKAGFPRCKSRGRFHSFTCKEYGNGARLDNGALVVSKIGRITVHWSRPIAGTPKTVTISHEADGWYVTISCAEVPMRPLPSTGQETAIDLGLEAFATQADGERIVTPRYYHKAEAHLQRCQRRVARRKKAVKQLANAYQHIARQRRDFHHQEAHKLVRAYDLTLPPAEAGGFLGRSLRTRSADVCGDRLPRALVAGVSPPLHRRRLPQALQYRERRAYSTPLARTPCILLSEDTGLLAESDNLLRRPAGPQHGPEPPLGQEHQRYQAECVPHHPHFQGCKRREASASGESCVHQPSMFGLRRPGDEGLVRPLALLPGVRDQSAPGP